MHHRISAGVVVLLYHRVTAIESDPQWLAVSPNLFDEQLAMLTRKWEIISIAPVTAGLASGKLPRRAVAITFDDGYADNQHQAQPILQKHAAAATIYVASGFVGQTQEMFSDELDRLLLGPSRMGGLLRAAERTWELPPLESVVKSWNVLQEPPPTARHAAYRDLCAIAAAMNHQHRRHLLETVRAWAGETAEGRSTHRFVSAEELRELAQSPGITIGAHTLSHPRLSALGLEDQRCEIVQSKRELERMTSKPVTSFAYPFGGPTDQTPDTIQIIRQAGFSSACVNFGGSVRRGDDPFRLNRILARDWTPAQLQQRIEESFVE